MKTESSADCHRAAGAAGRGDPDGLLRRFAPRNDKDSVGGPLDDARSVGAGRRQATPLPSGRILWLAVFFGFAALATAYFFVFCAAHEARIQSVPLVTKGGRP